MGDSTTGIGNQPALLLQAYLDQQTASTLQRAFTGEGEDGSTKAATLPFSDLVTALLGTNQASALSANPMLLAGTPQLPTTTLNLVAPGQRVANTAVDLAGDLRGPRYQSFDTRTTPADAQHVWQTAGWGNGNVQCVAFVAGAFKQAGVSLPFIGNANTFWSGYQNQPGWKTIANGAGLPQPGDILAMSGGDSGFGHVAVVTSVQPPSSAQPGKVVFAQSNAGTPFGALTINPDGTVASWPGYTVQGMLRQATA